MTKLCRDFYSHLDLNGDLVVDWHELGLADGIRHAKLAHSIWSDLEFLDPLSSPCSEYLQLDDPRSRAPQNAII